MTTVRWGYTLQFARRPLATTQSPPCRGDESAGKRSHRNHSFTPERFRLLQPLLLRPQKRRQPATYSRSQTPELCPDEKVVQDDHFETDPPANMPRGRVHVTGSERHVLSHPGSPPHHRWFLRFAFKGVAYQYKVLPFGLSLAPRTFTRCMGAALSPLQQMGIRILNYLDDWLILAQSQAVLTSHKTLLLSHLDCLGLRVNFAKSILSLSQRVSFLGYSYWLSADDSNCLSGVSPDNSAPRGLLQVRYRPSAQSFPENAGLMVVASPVLQLGLLHMRPIQFWLKQRVPWRLGVTDATA